MKGEARLLRMPVGLTADMDPEAWAAEMIEKAKERVGEDDEVDPVLLLLAVDPRSPNYVYQWACDLAGVLDSVPKEVSAQMEVLSTAGRTLVKMTEPFAVMLIHEVRELDGPVLVTLFETEHVHRPQLWRIESEADGRHVGDLIQTPPPGRVVTLLHATSSAPN